MGESLKSQQAVISQKLSIKLFLTKFSGSYELNQSEKNYIKYVALYETKIELNGLLCTGIPFFTGWNDSFWSVHISIACLANTAHHICCGLGHFLVVVFNFKISDSSLEYVA